MGALSRRGLLGVLAGGAVLGPQGAVNAALAAVRSAPVAASSPGLEVACASDGMSMQGYVSPRDQALRNLRSDLWNKLETRRAQVSYGTLPAHLASKKSWSPVFKQSEATRELTAIQEAINRLHEESFLEQVAGVLGITLPEV